MAICAAYGYKFVEADKLLNEEFFSEAELRMALIHVVSQGHWVSRVVDQVSETPAKVEVQTPAGIRERATAKNPAQLENLFGKKHETADDEDLYEQAGL